MLGLCVHTQKYRYEYVVHFLIYVYIYIYRHICSIFVRVGTTHAYTCQYLCKCIPYAKPEFYTCTYTYKHLYTYQHVFANKHTEAKRNHFKLPVLHGLPSINHHIRGENLQPCISQRPKEGSWDVMVKVCVSTNKKVQLFEEIPLAMGTGG